MKDFIFKYTMKLFIRFGFCQQINITCFPDIVIKAYTKDKL